MYGRFPYGVIPYNDFSQPPVASVPFVNSIDAKPRVTFFRKTRGFEIFDVPLALVDDALIPPGIVLPNGRVLSPRRQPMGVETFDVPLALAQDALTPPGQSETVAAMRMAAQRNMRRAGVESIPNFPIDNPPLGTGNDWLIRARRRGTR